MSKEYEQYRQLDLQYLFHPITDIKSHVKGGPRVFSKGEGIYIFDLDGKRYIDGLAGLWNVTLGHSQREIADAVREQIGQLPYSTNFFGFSNPPCIELAEKIASLTPGDLNRVQFTSGGSESNETNFKIARYYWKLQGYEHKTKILSRRFSYHGTASAATAATGLPRFDQFGGPFTPNFIHIAPMFCYRCEFDMLYPACEIACAQALEKTILQEGPDTVAALIVEPVAGAGGVIPPVDEYFPAIRDICSKYNVLLIADEVITGFGRTGKMFGVEHWNIVPDMMSVAKGITSGYIPLGAAIVKEEIYQTIVEKIPDNLPWLHGFTYSGHPVACAAGIKTLEILEREKIIENTVEKGFYFLNKLKQLSSIEIVGDVRGLGLMAGIELVKDRTTKAYFKPSMGARVAKKAYENGLIVRPAGEVLELAPPLIITREEIDELVTILEAVLQETNRKSSDQQ